MQKFISSAYYSVVFCILLIYPHGLSAQNKLDSVYREQVTLVTDRSVYLTGEDIAFSAWIFSNNENKQNVLSSILKLDVLNPGNGIATEMKAEIIHGRSFGHFPVPSGLNTGYYILRAYTRWMGLLDPSNIGEKLILIVNPSRPFPLNSTINSLPYDTGQNQSITISRMKPKFDFVYRWPRRSMQKVDFSGFASRIPKGNYAISFHHQLPEKFRRIDPIQKEEIRNESFEFEFQNIIPEKYGPLVSGRVMSIEKQSPIGDAGVFCFFQGPVSDVRYCKTDSFGRFVLFVPSHYPGNEITLFCPDSNLNSYIKIDQEFSLPDNFKIPITFIGDSSLLLLIEQMNLNVKVSKAFEDHNSRKSLKKEALDLLPFYGKEDFQINLRDYLRLPDLEEVFRELVPPVLVRLQNGQTSLKVLDAFTNRPIGDNPLILLDGIPVTETQKILKMDPGEVKSVAVFTKKFVMGEWTSDGIIDIHTIQKKSSRKYLPSNSISIPYTEVHQKNNKYNPSNSIIDFQEHLPYFNNTSYWNPDVILNPKSDALELVIGDNTGSFTIDISGFSENGNWIRVEVPVEIY